MVESQLAATTMVSMWFSFNESFFRWLKAILNRYSDSEFMLFTFWNGFRCIFLNFWKSPSFLLIMGYQVGQIYQRPDEKNLFLAQNDSQNVPNRVLQEMGKISTDFHKIAYGRRCLMSYQRIFGYACVSTASVMFFVGFKGFYV